MEEGYGVAEEKGAGGERAFCGGGTGWGKGELSGVRGRGEGFLW